MTFDPKYFDDIEKDLVVRIKIGIDGARSGSNYSHHFEAQGITDEHFVLASFVILDIKCKSKTIYQNDKPNSSSFTRPFFFAFAKESPTLTREVIGKAMQSLKFPGSFSIAVDGRVLSFNFGIKAEITMIDGKTTNALVENNATLRCSICLLTARDFMGIIPGEFEHTNVKESLKLSMNTLHFQIKIFEFMLTIAERKFIFEKKSENDTIDKEELTKALKEFRQKYEEEFWKSSKAQINIVKPGYGSSTTGPNTERAMINKETCAEILNLDEELVDSFDFLRKAFSSKSKPIKNEWMKNVKIINDLISKNFAVFGKYSPTMHKIIVHGFDIIHSFEYGPGYYTEQSQEALNKIVRRVRLNNTRKTSHDDNLNDILSYLYCSTDPFIMNLF